MLKPPKLQPLIWSSIQTNQLTLERIIQRMGYARLAQPVAIQRLERVLSKDDLGVTQSAYDFKYTAHEFVRTLCQAVGIEPKTFEPLIEDLKIYAHYVYHSHTPSVYADVDLPTPPKISILLATYTHGRKRVRIDERVTWLDENEQIDIIKQAIRKHRAGFEKEFTNNPIKGYDVYINGRTLYFTLSSIAI